MTLSDYLKSQSPRMSNAAFAARVGTVASTISRLRRGQQGCSLHLALAIEHETGGQVSACLLSPDVAKARATALCLAANVEPACASVDSSAAPALDGSDGNRPLADEVAR
jgi:DNA-binding transcriptional regulator YdaS (Cro superfamily)